MKKLPYSEIFSKAYQAEVTHGQYCQREGYPAEQGQQKADRGSRARLYKSALIASLTIFNFGLTHLMKVNLLEYSKSQVELPRKHLFLVKHTSLCRQCL